MEKIPTESTASGRLWGRGCILASLAFILFFIFLIAIRSWQVRKSPFEQSDPAVLEQDTLPQDSLTVK